jgi:hypothetical protein
MYVFIELLERRANELQSFKDAMEKESNTRPQSCLLAIEGENKRQVCWKQPHIKTSNYLPRLAQSCVELVPRWVRVLLFVCEAHRSLCV